MPTPPVAPAVRVLAFDTSTEQLALALQGPDGPLTLSQPGGSAASTILLPQIHALLARADMTLSDLEAIAFGRGPGAFTGLRTACAVAQGLGFGLGLPLLPIDSLLIVAEDARLQTGPGAADLAVEVAMDARMDEVYAGRYRWDGHAWSVIEAPSLRTLAAQAAEMASEAATGVTVFAGSAWSAFSGRLPLHAGARACLVEADRPGALLSLARHAAVAGAGIDAAAALPLYLRDKVALTSSERELARRTREAAAQP